MNRRTVRTVAVCAIVLVTLTGARRSGGGGCGGSDDKSSGSSSSSGGSGYNSTQANPINEVRIDTCEYDEAVREYHAKMTITNPSSATKEGYLVDFAIQNTDGSQISSAQLNTNVPAGQSKSDTGRALATDTPPTTFQCKVVAVTKLS